MFYFSVDLGRRLGGVILIRGQIWDGLKVVTIEIIEIVTTIIVTTFKRCNNLNML